MIAGEMTTGTNRSVRSTPLPLVRVRTSTANEKPRTIWRDTVATPKTRVLAMAFQKTRSWTKSA